MPQGSHRTVSVLSNSVSVSSSASGDTTFDLYLQGQDRKGTCYRALRWQLAQLCMAVSHCKMISSQIRGEVQGSASLCSLPEFEVLSFQSLCLLTKLDSEMLMSFKWMSSRGSSGLTLKSWLQIRDRQHIRWLLLFPNPNISFPCPRTHAYLKRD